MATGSLSCAAVASEHDTAAVGAEVRAFLAEALAAGQAAHWDWLTGGSGGTAA